MYEWKPEQSLKLIALSIICVTLIILVLGGLHLTENDRLPDHYHDSWSGRPIRR